ncbi:pro-sigmaK processing inhibitor BofA family protein [Natranaerobius trueperi]|uniref:SigmaK-factor processing regulatory BofA n=1 Tax=Natranaerobius trueperi TaxID=759412 RepID=A0A226BZT2_9FIRM|nr:pro-sigmaK processing inhibitor BofA family protein [Natranaerobius trueperi]OWZ83630.1 SigmaK-factor processing regulatory BofA [Natranaerobius trueperi]
MGELNFWFSMIFGIVLLYLLTKIMIKPARICFILLGKAFIGALILLALNTMVNFFFDFQIAINFITALTVGFLGLPGIIMITAVMVLLI